MGMEKIAIIGSGNWGSAIAKIIGENAAASAQLDTVVQMYTYEEEVDGGKLTEIINSKHENVKYLPGVKLPDNVVANPDVVSSVKDATLLVFVLPHQFIGRLASALKGNLAPGARAISLIKGFAFEGDKVVLISDIIKNNLGLSVSALMGANVANEVAAEQFCEATVGCVDAADAAVWKSVFQRPYFKIDTVSDVYGVELCGGLKNIVAIAAGISDGLGFGGNTKAAIIRIGLMEMKLFAQSKFPGVLDSTFLESCGVADLITTCFGGRNRKVAEAYAKTGRSFEELEVEMLNGQKLQGTLTAKEVNIMLKAAGEEATYPLFTQVYKIAYEGVPAADLLKVLG